MKKHRQKSCIAYKTLSRELTWFNWAGSEPNNQGNEDYIVALGSEDWQWVDQRGNDHSAEVICEYQVNGKSKVKDFEIRSSRAESSIFRTK